MAFWFFILKFYSAGKISFKSTLSNSQEGIFILHIIQLLQLLSFVLYLLSLHSALIKYIMSE
jgi:hypothetical protein